MNNAPQPQPTQAADPDMALLDALAGHIILDEHPKTLLGLAITARAEKWLRRSTGMGTS